ncbi:MAG TPA: hypothetical protein VKB78_08020, partial [Pirellulales bacterium]|nr:hypothetical protein [Pirellulales bacterium]
MFKWAITNELFDGRNPAEGTTRPRNDSANIDDGHLPCPVELIEKYEKRWPLGTRERVQAAGIPVANRKKKTKGYSAHGLRKASATIAAESGASEAELNAVF